MTFMIAVLGSLVFWAIYFCSSLVMALITIKMLGGNRRWRSYYILKYGTHPRKTHNSRDCVFWEWDYYRKGESPLTVGDRIHLMFAIFYYMLGWPFIAIFFVIKCILDLLTRISTGICRMLFNKIPEVEVSYNKGE